jgi:hypothetical protein
MMKRQPNTRALIKRLRGSLKGKPGEPSLTELLLQERAEDLRREEKKLNRFPHRRQRRRSA